MLNSSIGKSAIYLVLLPAFLSAGCATQYTYKQVAGAAELTIAGNSRRFFVETHKDETCAPSKHGVRVATFYGPTANVADHEKGLSVQVPADQKFFLSFRYIDAQFGLNRMCNMMVDFVPSAGAKYKAYFSVKSDVTECSVTLKEISDNGEREVPSFSLAPNVCLNGQNFGPINGRAQRLKWEVQVIRIP